MGQFSILPESLSFIETWLVRLFLLLAILTLGPWLLALVYDLLLYIWRFTTYEIPYVGGRARGQRRPRVPSLTERPSGHKRGISLPTVLQVPEPHGSDGQAPGVTYESAEPKNRIPYQSSGET